MGGAWTARSSRPVQIGERRSSRRGQRSNSGWPESMVDWAGEKGQAAATGPANERFGQVESDQRQKDQPTSDTKHEGCKGGSSMRVGRQGIRDARSQPEAWCDQIEACSATELS